MHESDEHQCLEVFFLGEVDDGDNELNGSGLRKTVWADSKVLLKMVRCNILKVDYPFLLHKLNRILIDIIQRFNHTHDRHDLLLHEKHI